jgi:hypothetical protein
MKERPILFSGPMIRAILNGSKTQTRRIARKPKSMLQSDFDTAMTWAEDNGIPGVMASPYGYPGERLWVRETCWIFGWWKRDGKTRTGKARWRFVIDPSHQVRFDDPPREERCTKREGPIPGWCRRPSIHMPRWASRITLDVTNVRVERLQDITEADALAEGMPDTSSVWDGVPGKRGGPRETFQTLWNAINAKRAPWSSNPWVWVVEFSR